MGLASTHSTHVTHSLTYMSNTSALPLAGVNLSKATACGWVKAVASVASCFVRPEEVQHGMSFKRTD